jgi:hypothetical protein
VRKIFQQGQFSELTDRSIETTASMMHIEEKLEVAELTDRLDDKRREEARKLIWTFFKRVKAMKSIEELKAITDETEAEFDRLCKLEDHYEMIDDRCRLSNLTRVEKVKVITKSMSSDLEKLHTRNYEENKKSAHAGRHETDTN